VISWLAEQRVVCRQSRVAACLQLWLEAEPSRLLNVSLCVQTSTSPDSWNIYRILGTTHSYEWWYSSPHACHWLQGLPPSLLLSSNSRFRCSCW